MRWRAVIYILCQQILQQHIATNLLCADIISTGYTKSEIIPTAQISVQAILKYFLHTKKLSSLQQL